MNTIENRAQQRTVSQLQRIHDRLADWTDEVYERATIEGVPVDTTVQRYWKLRNLSILVGSVLSKKQPQTRPQTYRFHKRRINFDE